MVEIPLRLRDPQAAAAFAERLASEQQVRVGDWLEARRDFTDESRRTLAILGTSTLLALLAAGFTLATAIGGRVLADRRRIGLLRAVGVTPRGRDRRARRPLPRARRARRAVRPARRAGCWRRRCWATRSCCWARRRRGRPACGSLALVLRARARGGRARDRAPRLARRPAAAGGRARAGAAVGRPSARRARPRIVRALRLPVVAALGAKDAYVQRARAVLTMASLALAASVVVCALRVRGDDGPARGRAGAARAAVGPDRRHRRHGAAGASTALLASAPGVADVGRRYGIARDGRAGSSSRRA